MKPELFHFNRLCYRTTLQARILSERGFPLSVVDAEYKLDSTGKYVYVIGMTNLF